MVPIPAAIMKGFPPSTPFPQNPFFTPKKPVVCTGFAVRATSLSLENPKRHSEYFCTMISVDRIDKQGYLRARWIPRDLPVWNVLSALLGELGRLAHESSHPPAPAASQHNH
jgi:hypothetical protein